MDKLTQNSAKALENEVLEAVVDNVNTAICFFKNKPSTVMRLSLEETIIDNLPFAKLIAKRSLQGKILFEQLEKLGEKLMGSFPIFKLEMPEQGE